MSRFITIPNFDLLGDLLNQKSQASLDRQQTQKDLLPAIKQDVDAFLKLAKEKFIGRMGENGLREDKDRDAVIHHTFLKYQSISNGGVITQQELRNLTEIVKQLGELADIVEGKVKISNDEILNALQKNRLGLLPNQELYASTSELVPLKLEGSKPFLSKEYLLEELLKRKGFPEKIEKILNENQEFDFSKFWNNLDSSALNLLGTAFAPPFKTSVSSINVTRGFGMHLHPILRVRKHHKGIDIGKNAGLERGDDILASRDGVVVHAGNMKGYGNTVVIDHGIIDGKRYFTLYAHLDKITVKPSQVLSTQQKLGEMGNTGLSTAPHLHFEIRRGSANQTFNKASDINPAPLLRMGGLNLR